MLIGASGLPAAEFRDPKPPAFVELRATAAAGAPNAAARDNPEVTFHAAPGPLASRAVTGDWAAFMGPTHNMFSPETAIAREFPKDGLKPRWELKKGEGYASPAVAGRRLVFFHRVGAEEIVECLDAESGRRFWQHRYATAYRDRYGFNGGPRASPVIAEGRVFTFGAAGTLHCLALATGRVLWRRDVLEEFKVEQNFFGVGATPLVEKDKLIVNIGAPGGPGVVAFDVRTGKMLWGADDQWGPSYASPVPATLAGQRRVLVFAGGESKPATGGLLALDPENGRVDFAFPWRGTRYESVNASSPIVVGDRVFVSECYGAGGVMVDATGKKVWENAAFGMHFMCPIPLGGHIYGVINHGPSDSEFVCVEAATGKEVWRHQPMWTEQVTSRRGPSEMKVGTFRASLLMVEGRALCLGEFGHLLWLDLKPDGYHELARTWLFAATETWTPPVLSRGLLYVCQNTKGALNGEPPRLLCYDLRGE
ncbi:MAG: PQQ-like beta-propeller repeat protein [Verrucomicrobia bacterium]|nr:PQQ-like beta-propeller repeat protein [Verrucomicrobiota bacterium]